MTKEEFRELNHTIMVDTQHYYKNNVELISSINSSIDRQYMVRDDEVISYSMDESIQTEYLVTSRRTFEAARRYREKKVAVLNFANNHSIGGAPYAAGAQEESMCRCSTLYPCLQAMDDEFYKMHQRLYAQRKLDNLGNDDLIYTPDVVVFKSDKREKVIQPELMPFIEWYMVDVITCAAPELHRISRLPENYEQIIESRIKKILDVAAKEQVKVLILGKWGCGAFNNPIDIIAKTFSKLLKQYHFEIVEFAMGSYSPETDASFYEEFGRPKDDDIEEDNNINRSLPTDTSISDDFLMLLRSTGRENIENVITWLWENSFFTAPASVDHHNACKSGLLLHSMDVYREAMRLNKTYRLPQNSVILCSLLHDVCKSDQYYIDENNKPQRNESMITKGHGRRSMFILKRACQLPLNYDEEMAIWWHMGEHEPSQNKKYSQDYDDSQNIKLCKLIQHADGYAAHLSEKISKHRNMPNATTAVNTIEYTPDKIEHLNSNEIFVFGSNIAGHHRGGAARSANKAFGAEWGIGEGPTGQCYAIPTMEGGVDYIQGKVNTFLNYVREHRELKFYVTKIGCGIAGFKVSEIAPLFADAKDLSNVILPKEFYDYI